MNGSVIIVLRLHVHMFCLTETTTETDRTSPAAYFQTTTIDCVESSTNKFTNI